MPDPERCLMRSHRPCMRLQPIGKYSMYNAAPMSLRIRRQQPKPDHFNGLRHGRLWESHSRLFCKPGLKTIATACCHLSPPWQGTALWK